MVQETYQTLTCFLICKELEKKSVEIKHCYYLIVKFYMFYKVCFIFNYFWGFGFLVFYCPATFDLYCDWSKQSHEYLLQIRNLV
jgi:hypothetical protein